MKIFVAFNSVPDYTARNPLIFKSVHHSLDGAIKALYPGREDFQDAFTKSSYDADTWNGPDGFGMVKLVEVLN